MSWSDDTGEEVIYPIEAHVLKAVQLTEAGRRDRGHILAPQARGDAVSRKGWALLEHTKHAFCFEALSMHSTGAGEPITPVG